MDPATPYYMVLTGIDASVDALSGTVAGFSPEWAEHFSTWATASLVVGCVVVLLLCALVIMQVRK